MMTYEWKSTQGKTIRLDAEYTERVTDDTVWLDGDEVNTGDKKIVVAANLTAFVDGKRIATCYLPNFWQIIDVPNAPVAGLKKIWGINGIAFTAERAAEIEAFLNDVIASGKIAEANEIRAEEQAAEDAEELERAEKIIEKAEAQKDIPSREEAKRWMKWYNDAVNEGGEGFVPYVISREEYEAAKRTVERLKSNA